MKTSNQMALDYVDIGVKKSSLNIIKTFISAILAGMFIAFAGLASTVASCTVENSSVAKLIASCVFPAGLAMVVLVGTELFTGDCLIVISVLKKKVSVLKFIRTLIIVYIGNLVGSLIVSAGAVYGHTLSMFNGKLLNSVISTAQTKATISFSDGLIRGIFCNVLVCLAVWIALCAKNASGKILGLFFPIMVFVVCGFEHSVANMYYIPTGIMALSEYNVEADGLTWFNFFITNELPVTLGNIIGGVGLGIIINFCYGKKGSEK